MKNYLDIDEQISQNKEALDFYYSSFQKMQNKVPILGLIYSVIAIYFPQVIKYSFETFSLNLTIVDIFYFLSLIVFIVLLGISIWYTYLFLKPIKTAFLNLPEHYYTVIKSGYEESLEETDENTLNAYIKVSYLKEIEEAVKCNSNLFEKKSKYYSDFFRFGLFALIFYVICSGFVIIKNNESKDFSIQNYEKKDIKN